MSQNIFEKIPDNNVESEAIFNEILDSVDGDYVTQSQVLAKMKPAGW